MQQHYDHHPIRSRRSEWYPDKPRSHEKPPATEHRASYVGQSPSSSRNSRHTTPSQSRSLYTAHTRSRSPCHLISRQDSDFPWQDGYYGYSPQLAQAHSADRPLDARNPQVFPHSPRKEGPRILFRSVDRNETLAGNKISTSRCRDDQIHLSPQPALPNPSPEKLGATLPATTPTGPRPVPRFSADGKPPRPGGPWTPIQRYHLEKLLAHGCVTNTPVNAQHVGDVWLKVSPERGGGYGFGLTVESVMRYISYQSGRFSGKLRRRRHRRQVKWARWLLENREAAMKDGLEAESGGGEPKPFAGVACGGGSALASAGLPMASPSLPPDFPRKLTSTNNWSPPYVPQETEEYEESVWWKECKLPLQPAASALSTAPTPGVEEVLQAIRAVTANKDTGAGHPEASFLSNPQTPQSKELGSSEISQPTTPSINPYPQDLNIIFSQPAQQLSPSTATEKEPLSTPPGISTHPTYGTNLTPTPAIATPPPPAMSLPIHPSPPTDHLVNSGAATHSHLEIHVTRGEHGALLDQLLDMPGDITLHNSSLTKEGGDREQVIIIRVEVPRGYEKFMVMMIRMRQGVRAVVGVGDC